MFDVSRLQDATKLAKDLVDRGIAKNYEEAHKMIEEQNMVRTEGEVSVVSGETKPNKEAEPAKGKCNCEEENKALLSKIDGLEKNLKAMSDFLSKYSEQNDKNMQEVDERLKRLEQGKNLKPEIQKKIQSQSQERPADRPISGNGEGLNPNDFSVEKFFNNAHGKMEKK